MSRAVLGKDYHRDDAFKARARLHQSRYRAEVLRVSCDQYGSKLLEADARRQLIYYDGLGVRDAKHARYPEFSIKRDGDLLRSEHIPFNLFGPLVGRPSLAREVLRKSLNLDCEAAGAIRIEWAPPQKELYLDDATSFDTIIWFTSSAGVRCAAGIEVKYTEGAYPIGKSEKSRVDDPESTYWTTARRSGAFLNPAEPTLAEDSIRQFWRNHLLGLAMVLNGDVDEFHSLVLYLAGNPHCAAAVPQYRSLLCDEARARFRGVTFEEYIGALDGAADIRRWRDYLDRRYLFPTD